MSYPSCPNPYPKKNTTSWLDFFGRLAGAPELIVSDMDGAITKALGIAFPPTATSTTRQHWCELHTYRSLVGNLRRVPANHQIRDLLHGALRGQAHRRDGDSNELPSVMCWEAGATSARGVALCEVIR